MCIYVPIFFIEPDLTGFAACCVNTIAISPKDEQLYGLRAEDSFVLKHNVGTQDWTVLSNMACQAIEVSNDGVLWCLKDGDILEWSNIFNQWFFAMVGANCKQFDVANTYIICVSSDRLTKRKNRSSQSKYFSNTDLVLNLDW